MSNIAEMSLARRQLLLGRAIKMFTAGYSVEKIRAKLNLSESQVRPLIEICEEAKQKRDKVNAAAINVVH